MSPPFALALAFVGLSLVILPRAHAQISVDAGGAGGGAVRVGASTTTCDSAATGALRYNSVSNYHEFCNGLSWQAIGSGGGQFTGWGMDKVATSQATTSSTYTDLATTGPAVTLATDTTALVTLTGRLSNSNASVACKMGFAVSGASTAGASDAQALIATSAGANGATLASATFYVTGLTAGSNTFTAKYARGANTCSFAERHMVVIAAATTAVCSDTTPNTFAFTDLVNQSTSTLVTSDIVQLTGFNCTVNTGVSGTGSPSYRICADPACSTVVQDWTSGISAITPGQYAQLRLTTSAAGGDTRTATFTAGNGADSWSAGTTGDCTGSPAVGTICADGTVYAGTSPDGAVKMYTTRCDAGETWSGSACTGSAFYYTWNNGNSPSISAGAGSGNTGEANTTTLAGLSNAESPYVAAQYCDSLSAHGNTDWYLPATNELWLLIVGKTAIGNFAAEPYWTSTEHSGSAAQRVHFADDSWGVNNKNDDYLRVRCVRR